MVRILIITMHTIILHYTKLENVNVIKDLGVNFDPDLSFVLHCQEKINKALCNAGDHKDKFYVCLLIKGSFVLLHKAHVRSQLQYANSV